MSGPVTLGGMLVDQGCYTTHTRHKETNSDDNSTTTTETTKVATECPATTTTSSFAMVTPEGKFVRFDEAGNTRVIEMVKSNKNWRNYIIGRKPVKVHVVGDSNGRRRCNQGDPVSRVIRHKHGTARQGRVQ